MIQCRDYVKPYPLLQRVNKHIADTDVHVTASSKGVWDKLAKQLGLTVEGDVTVSQEEQTAIFDAFVTICSSMLTSETDNGFKQALTDWLQSHQYVTNSATN
jgi:hypothetical protein